MKKIHCRWCKAGNTPRLNGKEHWIVKSIVPARVDIRECAYHKAGKVSPLIEAKEPLMHAGGGDGTFDENDE